MASQIAYLVAGALLGELIAWAVIWFRGYLQSRKRLALMGVWHSIYRPDFRDEMETVGEEIEIAMRLGKIRMRNRKNPMGDDYGVDAEVAEDGYLIGSWRSLRDGAHARGSVILLVNPLGNLMYGFFTGLGHTGERTFCGWVLARQEEDLGRGVELLRNAILAPPDSVLHRIASNVQA